MFLYLVVGLIVAISVIIIPIVMWYKREED